MAKDTEKLIRQLSLISYLMAERRPVTATEIRRDVEGYSDMTEDAFARRFYADRAELESLKIFLSVDRPADGLSEQEHYSLAREAFHLPAIAFTDRELASLQTALRLLDGQFAYAEPLRLALQQIAWGRPAPQSLPDQRTIGLGITAAAGGHELSQRLTKIDTAIYRRKRIEFEYYSMQRDETSVRRVDPYHLHFEHGHFYLTGLAHERGAIRQFRLDRIRGKVAYATKAEHDFSRPEDFDPRQYVGRIPWQLGDPIGTAEVWVSDRIAWMIERHYSRYGTFERADGGRLFRTEYALPRLLIGWVLGLGENASVIGPADLREAARGRLEDVLRLHTGEPHVTVGDGRPPAPEETDAREPSSRRASGESAIRPERFARLVTLASVLIRAGREGRRLRLADVCEQLQMSESEVREDVSVLNVVNFGGGTYVVYAEILPSGEIEVDTEPYSDTFDRPARLLPIEAKALVAAIDLIGDNLPGGDLASARDKIVEALGEDPVEEGLQIVSATGDDVARAITAAIERRRIVAIEYQNPAKDQEPVLRRIEPYALMNGREGWYISAYDLDKEDTRHFRLDRVKAVEATNESYEPRQDLDPLADIEGWPRTGVLEDSRSAHVWISPEQARWARELRTVLAEFEDGSIIVEWPFKGEHYLVKEVLEEAGDAAVLEPPEVREAVLRAAQALNAVTA